MSKHELEGLGSSSIPAVLYLVPYRSAAARPPQPRRRTAGRPPARSLRATPRGSLGTTMAARAPPRRSAPAGVCVRMCVCACARVRVCVAHFRDAEPSNSNTQGMLLALGDETAQRPCQVGARPFRHAARPPATGSTSPRRCRHQQWRLGRGHAHSRHPPGCVLCGVSRPCRFEWLPVRMAVTRVVV